MIEINLRPGGGVTESIRPAAYPPWARYAGKPSRLSSFRVCQLPCQLCMLVPIRR